MAIDFSSVKGLSIPEGQVLMIEDEYGQVLWCPSTYKDTLASSALMSWPSGATSATMQYGSTYICDWDGNGDLAINYSRTNAWSTTQIYGSYCRYSFNTGNSPYPSFVVSSSGNTYWSSYTNSMLSSPISIYGSLLNSNYSKQYLLILGSSNRGTGTQWGMKYCAITATYAPSVSLWSLNFETGRVGSTYRSSSGSVKLGFSTITGDVPNPYYPPY